MGGRGLVPATHLGDGRQFLDQNVPRDGDGVEGRADLVAHVPHDGRPRRQRLLPLADLLLGELQLQIRGEFRRFHGQQRLDEVPQRAAFEFVRGSQ
jgi:hypothetical protein